MATEGQVQRATRESMMPLSVHSHREEEEERGRSEQEERDGRGQMVELKPNQTQRRLGCGGGKFWPTNLPGILVRKEADRGDASWKKGPQRRRKEANLVNHFTELANFTTAELKLDLEQARLRETCLR